MEIKFINRTTNTIEIEHPPGRKLLDFLYQNPFGKNVILPVAKQKFITSWYGKMMDSPSSTNKIKPFVDSLQINMAESAKQMDEFKSFNDFFYRALKPGSRPIQNGLVSPGDGRILAFENISELQRFFVKGKEFTLPHFLKNDILAEKFSTASMVILRLAPNDYHRYHFPYSGIASKSKKIEGIYYSVSPISLKEKFTEVFTENKREMCRITTENKGEILILPVGATMVGSIFSTYTPETKVEKGQEMGYFAFGGSTIVLLFDSKAFKLDADLVQNTKKNLETYVKTGEQIGTEI
jgi:phosphatidylserine decarboxylase